MHILSTLSALKGEYYKLWVCMNCFFEKLGTANIIANKVFFNLSSQPCIKCMMKQNDHFTMSVSLYFVVHLMNVQDWGLWPNVYTFQNFKFWKTINIAKTVSRKNWFHIKTQHKTSAEAVYFRVVFGTHFIFMGVGISSVEWINNSWNNIQPFNQNVDGLSANDIENQSIWNGTNLSWWWHFF